jgi:PqqD family protein of HPr-rel-A system
MENKIIAQKMGDEFMLYHVARGEVHFLNDAAALIYQLHCQGKCVAEIAQAFGDLFEVTGEENVSAQIEMCLHELRQKGLLAESTTPPTRSWAGDVENV